MIDTIWQDLQFNLRVWRKTPMLTAIMVLCLALGIGPNTTIFSLVDAVLLRPLDVHDPARLVEFRAHRGDGPDDLHVSYREYLALREHLKNKAEVGLTSNVYFTAELPDRTIVTKGSVVSSNFFDVLGRSAKLGRTFHDAQAVTPGRPAPIVLNSGFWHEELHSDREIVGRMLRLDGRVFEVIGVMTDSFTGVRTGIQTALWMPIEAAQGYSTDETSRTNFARMATGMSLSNLNSDLAGLAPSATESDSGRGSQKYFTARPLMGIPADERGVVAPVTVLLEIVVGLVLLVACSSVSALLLMRAIARRREIAIRLALGATRGRLVRQLLTESAMLALLAGSASLPLARWSLHLLVALLPPAKPQYYALNTSMDYRVLGFTMLVSVMSILLFGLVPAIQATHPDLMPALKGQVAIKGFEFRTSRLRSVFVVVQLAVSVLLVIIAGLFLKDMRKAYSADVGFDADKLVALEAKGNASGATPDQALAAANQLAERLSRVPGVESVALARHMPLSPKSETKTDISPIEQGAPSSPHLITRVNTVAPSYFRTAGVRLLAGRLLRDEDNMESSSTVVIINHALAEALWPGKDPIGRSVTGLGWARNPHDAPEQGPEHSTVVGVVSDSSYRVPGEKPGNLLYVPFRKGFKPLIYGNFLTILVRAKADPSAIVEPLRREIAAAAPTMDASDLRLFDAVVGQALWPLRAASFLFGALGILALILALTGVYGVVSYNVNVRNFEIAIRMALGARPWGLVFYFMRQGLILVLVGVGTGTLGVPILIPIVRPFLSGGGSIDMSVPLMVAALFIAVSAFAIFISARRAANVDPMIVLRYE